MTDAVAGSVEQASHGVRWNPFVWRGRRGWPRLHLIYFVLAMFDLVAVGGGLYLSHRLSALFETSTIKNQEWSERFVSIWKLGDLALELNGAGNDVFETHNVAAERKRLAAASETLSLAIDKIRSELAQDVPPALASYPIKTLTFVDQAMANMLGHANRTLTEYENGNFERAAASMALMNRSFVVLNRKLNDSVSAVRQIQSAYARGYMGQVDSLKRYELLIGSGMLAMVCCVVLYGHMVGRFVTRKYRDLEASQAAALQSEQEARQFAREAEAARQDAERLNGELTKSLEELGKAQDDAIRKGKLAQLGQLTATVAHELRNPLGAVRTSTFLLERKTRGLGLEPQINRINNGITRCDGIISQLLDFARTKELVCDTVDFDDWLAGQVEEHAQHIPQVVAIECRLGLNGAKVTFDPARFTRVIANLLNNASEAMVGRGDDPEKYTVREPRIVVATARTARGVEVTVSDNGPGMSAETQAKIMEPLFTTKSFGTGLGLPAIVKILEQHGGGLDVRSTPGSGASFTAWIKAEEAAIAA